MVPSKHCLAAQENRTISMTLCKWTDKGYTYETQQHCTKMATDDSEVNRSKGN